MSILDAGNSGAPTPRPEWVDQARIVNAGTRERMEQNAMRTPVSVTGMMLRKLGDDIEVLAEVEGTWRLVIVEPFVDEDAWISHIAEPYAIRTAPMDTAVAQTGQEGIE